MNLTKRFKQQTKKNENLFLLKWLSQWAVTSPRWRDREQTGQLYGSKLLLANPARALKTVNQTKLVP